MIYIEYEQYRCKYLDLQEQFNHFLTEKERILTKTLPNAIRYDKDKTSSSLDGNPLEDYVIELEESKVDESLDRIRQLLEDRERLLQLKEKELRMSQDVYDRIYRMKYLDCMGTNKIAKIMHYSRSQVYRILENIKKRCGR